MKRLLPCFLFSAALVAQAPGSSFGNTRTRELAELGRLPTPRDVDVSDLVDDYPHRLPPPRAGEDVGLDLRFDATSAGDGAYVLQVGYATAPADDRADVPPVHLALVLDCSGSMQAAGKMDRLKEALAAFTRRLRRNDRITLVTYSDEARTVAEARAVGDRQWLQDAIAGLEPGGATNLHAGLMAGLHGLQRDTDGPRTRRVILLTDGIANRGEVDPERILADARAGTEGGIDLSTIGLGADVNTALLDRLARGSRGLFHFVADAADIDKVFRQQADTLLCPVARAVRLCVTLPSGWRLQQVFGYPARERGETFVVELPDLNRGVTAVVLATLRPERRPASSATLRLSARLDYTAARDGAARSVAIEDSAVVEGSPQLRLGDPEVRKNYTIAVLAQGMHDMADSAERERWVDADARLRTAIEFARTQYGETDDPDYRRVLGMAEGFRTTLRRRLDRFRND